MSRAEDVALWDLEAPTFDEAADHGLADPAVREVWRDLLLGVLPSPPGRVADLGCGTGTLTRLLADAGFTVDGVDFSAEMVARARDKLSGLAEATIVVGDAAAPPLPPGTYDAVLCRHVLWALPDPVAALARWRDLLRPDGVVVLVEGRWGTGAGLAATRTGDLAREAGLDVVVRPLPDPALWGRQIDDERYLVVARQPVQR